MRSNYREPKAKPPKSWDKLPDYEKEAILAHFSEVYISRANHEDAELQKIWLKMGCIVNHQMSGFGAIRARRWLHRWKRLYRKIETFKTAAERDAYLDAEMEKIFGKDGYPAEWVDSLENGGKQE